MVADESNDLARDAAIAPELNASDLARLPLSFFSGAAAASTDWLFARLLLNIPGPPNALLPRLLARRAGLVPGVCRCKLRAVAVAIFPSISPKCSFGGLGVSIRTLDLFSAVGAGISEKMVILPGLAVKAPLLDEVFGCGSEGRLALPWPSSATLSALLEAKKLV